MRKDFNYFGLNVTFFCYYNELIPDNDFLDYEKYLDNLQSSVKLNYGIFNKNFQKEIMQNAGTMFVFNESKDIIGFFVIPIFKLNEYFICNQGFVFLKENKYKIDFLNTLCSKLNEFVYNKIGDFFIFLITKNPLVYENVLQNFTDVWPNSRQMRIICNRKYLEIFDNMTQIYLSKFKSDEETLVFDKKRFVLKYENSNDLINKKINELSKAQLLENNLFLQYWLNSSQNEMVVLIGKYNKQNKIKNNKRIKIIESLF